MTETSQANNTNDKIAILMKEAESLKGKLDEERQKLNDITCKHFFHLFLYFFYVIKEKLINKQKINPTFIYFPFPIFTIHPVH